MLVHVEGDRPARHKYLERFPDDPAVIETALDSIDTEFALEEVILSEDQSSESQADQSTVTFLRNRSGQPYESITDAAVPRKFGKYCLERLIGRGGFGEVWKAYDPNLKRDVAVKIPRPDKHFPPEILVQFEKEAEKLATLGRIRGIVTVYEYGEHEGHPYIVTDFIEGDSLEPTFPIWVEPETDPGSRCRDCNTLRPPRV